MPGSSADAPVRRSLRHKRCVSILRGRFQIGVGRKWRSADHSRSAKTPAGERAAGGPHSAPAPGHALSAPPWPPRVSAGESHDGGASPSNRCGRTGCSFCQVKRGTGPGQGGTGGAQALGVLRAPRACPPAPLRAEVERHCVWINFPDRGPVIRFPSVLFDAFTRTEWLTGLTPGRDPGGGGRTVGRCPRCCCCAPFTSADAGRTSVSARHQPVKKRSGSRSSSSAVRMTTPVATAAPPRTSVG